MFTLDQAEKVSKIIAVVIGGAWASLNYFRGRTFKSRLELSLAGVARRTSNAVEVSAKLTAKNVGLSQVALEPIGSGLRVTTMRSDPLHAGEVVSKVDLAETYTFLMEHEWVEPGETVTDEIYFRVEDAASITAMRLVATQLGRALTMGEEVDRAKSLDEAAEENTMWTATAVVLIPIAEGVIGVPDEQKEKTHADTVRR